MILSSLAGVYDAAAGDRFGDVTLGELIGRAFTYIGSDGQRHHGRVRAICSGQELYSGLIVVFSSGYSDGHWAPLDDNFVAMLIGRR